MTASELKMLCLEEAQMAEKDEAVFKTEEKRNELEAYILRTKSFLASEWTQFIEQNEKKTFAINSPLLKTGYTLPRATNLTHSAEQQLSNLP